VIARSSVFLPDDTVDLAELEHSESELLPLGFFKHEPAVALLRRTETGKRKSSSCQIYSKSQSEHEFATHRSARLRSRLHDCLLTTRTSVRLPLLAGQAFYRRRRERELNKTYLNLKLSITLSRIASAKDVGHMLFLDSPGHSRTVGHPSSPIGESNHFGVVYIVSKHFRPKTFRNWCRCVRKTLWHQC